MCGNASSPFKSKNEHVRGSRATVIHPDVSDVLLILQQTVLQSQLDPAHASLLSQ